MPVDIASETEILENVKRNILEEKRSYLCKSLNPEDHFDFLRSKSILTKDDQDVIRNEVTRTAKAGKLLDILLTKGPKAYEMLVFSIHRNGTQNFLVKMLNKEFENKKNSYVALLNYKTNITEVDLIVDTHSLPTPGSNSKSSKTCTESDDGSLDRDFSEMYLRTSYAECGNRYHRSNGPTENFDCKDHDKICGRHQSDA